MSIWTDFQTDKNSTKWKQITERCIWHRSHDFCPTLQLRSINNENTIKSRKSNFLPFSLVGGLNFGVVGLDGKRVEEVEGGGRVEWGKRGVCVWNQVAGSCILSGVAGHTLPHWYFTAMQCIGIIRLELQAIKYPTALWVYNFSKSFSYAELKGSQHLAMQDLHALACRSVLPALQCVGRKSVTQMSVKCAVCCSV